MDLQRVNKIPTQKKVKAKFVCNLLYRALLSTRYPHTMQI